MKIKKESLLYDIANMAFVIADNGDNLNHGLHRLKDICEDGNRDRVARILGLAYARAMNVLTPIVKPLTVSASHDFSKEMHDYEICFREDCHGIHITNQQKLKIRETMQEYMVSMVLADWLAITLPEGADIWGKRAEEALKSLASTVMTVITPFGRRVPPL